MLDALILSDRAIEHDALTRISGRAAKRILSDTHRFGADQDTLRVEAVQDIGETLALLAYPVRNSVRTRGAGGSVLIPLMYYPTLA